MNNEKRLRDALELTIADKKFMGNDSKVDKAIEALKPKSTVSGTLKRLQGNAKRDFLDKKDAGLAGYVEEVRAEKIREYVKSKFKTHMDDHKTSTEAIKLFNAAYPQKETLPALDEEEKPVE